MLSEPLTRASTSRLLIWELGRPAELWLSYRGLISKLITQYKLKPLGSEAYPYLPMPGEPGMAALAAAPEAGKKALRWPWPIPFPGGIRIPHLHFDRDIYLVEPKQWREFSQSVVKDIQQRLTDTAEVNFEQTLQLGEAAAGLNR